MKKIITILMFLLYFVPYAQEEKIYLVEEKQEKRTIIYVKNDTSESKSVFLKVNPTGYRRSAQRPMLKDIPANSKVEMLILIPLTDKESYYTYDLIINEMKEVININKKT
ncbi:hypothetical protein [Aquimarina longa]|uniref:hypothetical protein n=1 Tax=Aquimarina longa TaxID=1080221 RepID=UPI0007830056|nr:hypothetical protein [Aquimarina longa]